MRLVLRGSKAMIVVADMVTKDGLFHFGAAKLWMQPGQPDMLMCQRAVCPHLECLRASELFNNRISACVLPDVECIAYTADVLNPGTLNITKNSCGAPIRDRSRQYSNTTTAF